jgi:TonB family protein
MKKVLLLLLLAGNARGQGLPHVRTEEAEEHLVSKPSPVYPQLAEQTRISGDVLLEIAIAEDGRTSVRRVISGHPLLLQAAINAVQNWHFQPFVIDGKPAAVVTAVVIPFGKVGNPVADQIQMHFQYDFWTMENLARSKLVKGDFPGAEEQLEKASELLARVATDPRNNPERLQWFVDSGDLGAAKQKYDDAERSYHNGLELLQKRDKEAPEIATVLAKLGALYAAEKRYDLARENYGHSIAIYRKHFKKAGSSNPGARQVYGAGIAKESWILSGIEREVKNDSESIKQCRIVIEFQEFLNTADRDSIVSACQKTIAEPH